MAGMDVAPATARTTWSQARKFDLQLQLEIDLKTARTLTQMASARAPLFTLPIPGFAGFFTDWNGRPSPLIGARALRSRSELNLQVAQ